MADTAFISYRRKPSASLAQLIQTKLKHEYGIGCYVDTTRRDTTHVQFPDRLMQAIADTPVFICLLANGTLDSDWVLEEIEQAHTLGKFCIPVFQESYKPTDKSSSSVQYLLNHDGIHVFDEKNIHIDYSVQQIANLLHPFIEQPKTSSRGKIFSVLPLLLLITLLIISGVLFLPSMLNNEETPPEVVLLETASKTLEVTSAPDNTATNTATPSETATRTSTPSETPTPTATQTPLGGSGQIAFVSDRDENEEIYVMNVDGSNLVNLTNDSGYDYDPAWSPDGSQIAFYSIRDGDGEIFVMDADGSNLTQLTNNRVVDSQPAWSPDGSQIAFVSNIDGNNDIYVMSTNGDNRIRLTDHPEDDYGPSWSPDGTRITFHSLRDANREIYIMNANGDNLVNLTGSPSDEFSPVWSPNGLQIAFVGYYGVGNIHVFDFSTGTITHLTDNGWQDRSPSWSPDGSRIVFHSNLDGTGNLNATDDNDIIIMNADGTNITNLTNHDAEDTAPAWKPR